MGQTSGTLGPNALYSYSAQEITALRRPPHIGDCRAGERNNGLAVPARQPRTGGSETRQEKGPRRLSTYVQGAASQQDASYPHGLRAESPTRPVPRRWNESFTIPKDETPRRILFLDHSHFPKSLPCRCIVCAVPSRLLGVTPRDSETTILLREVRTICKWDIFTYRCNNLREVKCEEAVLERLDGPPQLCKPCLRLWAEDKQASTRLRQSENSG